MRKVVLILFCFWTVLVFGQEASWSYIRLKPEVPMLLDKLAEQAARTGNTALDSKLNAVPNSILRKAFLYSKNPVLSRTYLLISASETLAADLVEAFPEMFEFYENLRPEDAKVFYPNDYGSTNPLGTTTTEGFTLDYLDYLDAPKAWYYTTGSRDIIIGISDGSLDTTKVDFKGKSKQLRNSSLSKGHGYSISANAAAQGNNGYGIPGICYDCSIYGTSYGHFKTLEQLVELSYAGAHVINCSWGSPIYYETAQQAIYEIYNNGSIVVAAAHNKDWKVTKGQKPYYPASYDKVISVSAVMHRYDDQADNILIDVKGNYYSANIKNIVGRTMGYPNNDLNAQPFVWPVSTANLNKEVDILAPSVGLFSYSKFILNDTISYSISETTSGATPLVSGTIGLMLSLNLCLSFEEVESILKATSTNIDDLEPNKRFKGYYGSGALNTGRAVTLTHHLMNPQEVAELVNQRFDRWDFEFRSLAKNTVLRNQVFTGTSTLDLKAKQGIELQDGVLLAPDVGGSILLEMDPELEFSCPEKLPENRDIIMPDKAKEPKRSFGNRGN